MRIPDLPFHIGATNSPHNPTGLPDTFPFSMQFDSERNIITQNVTDELLEILDKAYLIGQLIGTPLDEDGCGKPYADDFLNFINRLGLPSGSRVLEIGAGVGYLTHRLKQAGIQAIGIEPGYGYSAHWIKYKVDIVHDFFPTPRVAGLFDLICSYAVLEHVANPAQFLIDVRNHLVPDGLAVFSVPDCSDEILTGDPAILFHEHISYFDSGSLSRLIESVDMYAKVVKSGYGRCLYAVASSREIPNLSDELGLDSKIIVSYPERCAHFIKRVHTTIATMLTEGTLGVYCAARGLALLDPSWPMRFFDDDPALHGKYLPPFQTPIGSRKELQALPVDNLVIMSRSFGDRIRSSLVQESYTGKVITLGEL